MDPPELDGARASRRIFATRKSKNRRHGQGNIYPDLSTTAQMVQGHPLNQVLSPQDNEINRNIEGAVQDLRYDGRPENSSKALEPKKEEWLQYCDKVFPHDPYQYLVTSSKAYRFICYQMFREAKLL